MLELNQVSLKDAADTYIALILYKGNRPSLENAIAQWAISL